MCHVAHRQSSLSLLYVCISSSNDLFYTCVTDGDFVYIYRAIFKYQTDLFYCAQDIGAVVCPFIYHYATHTGDGFFGRFAILVSLYGQIAPVLAGRAEITPIPPVWMQE